MKLSGPMKNRNHARLLAAALLLALALPARGASFDCTRAKRPVEKMICADAQLSRQDEALAAAYQAAVAASAAAPGERDEQRRWLRQRDACPDAACLSDAYASRVGALERQKRYGRTYAEGDLSKNCLPAFGQSVGRKGVYKECRLRGVRPAGTAAGQSWFAAEYCLAPNDNEDSGCEAGRSDEGRNEIAVLVFSRAGAGAPLTLRLDYSDEGGNPFGGVQARDTPSGALLEVAFRLSGTGNLNASAYYLWRHGGWRRLDADAWIEDLQRRLPKGLGVWKGLWPDLERMAVDSPVWKDGDGNCCPSGGSVQVELAVDGDRLVIRSLKIGRRPVDH